MNLKNNLFQITGFILLCFVTNTTFSAEKTRSFILKNNSGYDLLYKPANDTASIGTVLKPGQR